MYFALQMKNLILLFLTLFFFSKNIFSDESQKENIKIFTNYHTLFQEKQSLDDILYNHLEKNYKPVGFFEFLDEEKKILIISGEGKLFYLDKGFGSSPFELNTNLNEIIKEQYYLEDRFSIKDTLITNIGDTDYLLVSYNKKLSKERECYNTSILFTEINQKANLKNKRLIFSDFFTYEECINYPFNPHASGGKIVNYNDKLLFSIGDFLKRGNAQDPESYFGKILLIDKNDKKARIFSSGHRNPQGLFVDNENNVYSTEHGPNGGDELNLILEGKNYGWPLVSYGTAYGFRDTEWGLGSQHFNDNHLNFKEPIYAFTPSIGINDLIKYEGNYYDRWKGDLIVSSLGLFEDITGQIKGASIYRFREDKKIKEKILNIERIFIGNRIRDVKSNNADGKIYLLTEEPSLIRLNRPDISVNYPF